MQQRDTPRPHADIGTKLLGEYVTDEYHLVLESVSDELECRAGITVDDRDNSISPAELISLLRKHDITDNVDLEQVAIFCSEAALGEDPSHFCLARGRAAIPGENGWFELLVTTAGEPTKLQEDATGRVDFKAIQAFTNVESGQQIGTIHPPTPGVPGETITGSPIPAPDGRPSPVYAGPGVRISDDGLAAIADIPGRVLFDNNRLSVVEELVIQGNVDLSVGHINFNGFVDIRGDILDDFHVTATKGINVTGAIGACHIKAEGPVTIGTMTGMGQGTIICRGALQGRYLNQVTVECHGDIRITHEVRNSTLKATGSIKVPEGLVTGGELIALEGIEVKLLGTRAGARTHLTSGVYFPESDRLVFLRKRVKSLSEQLKTLDTTLRMLHNKPLDKLRPALRDAFELRIGILTQRQVNLDEERDELSTELRDFTLSEHATANPKLNVLGAIRDGVILSLGEVSEELPTHISGPVSIIENSTEGGFRYLTYSPLKVSADDLQTEFDGTAPETD